MPTSAQIQLNARAWREKHQHNWRTLLDAFEKDITARQPKYAEAVVKRARGDVQHPLFDFLAKQESIRTSGRYSSEGEAAELRQAARAVQEKLAALRASTVDELGKQLDAKRAAALRRNAETDPALVLVRELRGREMRDQLRTLDPLKLQVRIRQAVNDGASTELLDALEGAPAGFPIAPPELVQEARVAIAERDHPELGELAQLRQSYTYLLGIAEQTLIAASGGNATATSAQKPFTLSGTPVPEVAR